MNLQIQSETGTKYDPVFLKIIEDIPGGVTVKTNRFPTATTEIKKGALLNASASSVGLYNIIKTVKLTAAHASATTILLVEAPHLFKVGEYIKLGVAAITISRVSATNIALETIGAYADIASGSVIAEASAAVAAAAAVKYSADAILRDTVEVRRGGVTTLLDNIFAGAVVRGTVDESELPYFVTSADKTALTARIRFA